ncbi:GRB10-interacting GYF protein 2-like [Saccostrea echinata]|uniref:GRB10-interacting GYF protein 2-like n=1 Tax=Saccostrea echinata TaxID=191078 RepID=UPI002A82674A|nr:GRB10-interacting GYF protein 2-like [Saccostrea echinata]
MGHVVHTQTYGHIGFVLRVQAGEKVFLQIDSNRMADTLKFGPEWLRALSDGNNVGTPPPSPGFGKYKLAEHRYGREEMLALFNPDIDPPEDLKKLIPVYVEKKQEPLALVPLSEEEQRILSQSVNSVAVLRMFGRGGPPGIRGARGGGPDRGRGRGRGRGDYMQRGMSYEETGGGFGRPPTLNRNDGWEEVGAKRNYNTARYDDGSGGPPKREFNRSLSSENWRDRGGNEDEEDEGDWRRAGGSKWNTRGSWRDPSTRGGFDADRRQNGIHRGGFDRGGRSYQRSRTSESWDDDEILPEWSMPDSDDVEEVGTFDSSGAFVSTKPEDLNNKEKDNQQKEVTAKSPPPDTKDSGKVESKQHSKEETSKYSDKVEEKVPSKKQDKVTENKTVISNINPQHNKKAEKPKKEELKKQDKSEQQNSAQNSVGDIKKQSATLAVGSAQSAKTEKKSEEKERDQQPAPKKKGVTVSEVEREALDRLQDTAENMVLSAMTAEEEEKEIKSSPIPPTVPQSTPSMPQVSPSIAVPMDHENAQKWFYRDPQGDTQGPFASNEMAEWFSAGYFTMDLYVRRGCDDKFSPLGELIKRWGRVPFLPGPAAPPLLNAPPTSQPSLEQLHLQQQQEQLKALHAQYLLQQQVMHQQLLRQFQMQQIQQIMQHVQENSQYKNLSPAQQKQIAMQLLMKQTTPVMLPMQPKLSPRSPPTEVAASLADHPPTSSSHPSFHRSMSQPSDLPVEDGSIWGGVQPVPTGANPNSVWDVNPHSRSTPDLEQERVRREKEEELLRKKREEEAKREQEYLKKQEELLKQQMEIQREKEEMERKREELKLLELQKIEEARRKEEEARRRQEEEERLKQQREEELRKLEELRKKDEEMRQRELKRQEEMKRQEELQRQQQELFRQQEQKKREMEELEKQKQLEIQRRQEQQRQQQEALKKLQQEQLANIQLPSHAQWGSQPATQSPQKTKSLLEIQKQEEMDRREKEELQRKLENERQQMMALQQQQQQQKSWSSQIFPSQQQSMKTLLEIQEEQRKLEEEKQQKQQQSQAKQNLSLGAASAWGGGLISSSHWASEGAWGNAARQSSTANSSASNGAGSLGFWDDAIISSKRATKPSNQGGVTTEFPTLKGQPQQKAPPTAQSNKGKPSKRGKEEEAVQRLFKGSGPVDDFSQWCDKALKALNTSVDIPTFVAFLKEVESPYEVHDYVRVYVGESKGAQDFAKQFLEKRSQSRNRARQPVEDSIWGPAPARDFRQSGGNQNNDSDTQKAKGKKKKKMQKIDSSILGFTCAADPDRINVGEIDADSTPK